MLAMMTFTVELTQAVPVIDVIVEHSLNELVIKII